MSNPIHFMTGSHYIGQINTTIQAMDGFGVYISPEGNEYRGYFRDGKYHGYGRLKLSSNNFIYKGIFQKGSLIEIEEMIFSDDLKINVTFDGKRLDTNKWSYLNPDNRLFVKEQIRGMQPVGPTSFLTKDQNARQLLPGTYDTEEGIYHPKTGFMLDDKNIPSGSRYLGCKREENWIKQYCRKGVSSSNKHVAIDPKTALYVMDANIKAMKHLRESDNTCSCNAKKDKKQTEQNWCTVNEVELKSSDSSNWLNSNDSSSCQSFTSALKLIDIYQPEVPQLARVQMPGKSNYQAMIAKSNRDVYIHGHQKYSLDEVISKSSLEKPKNTNLMANLQINDDNLSGEKMNKQKISFILRSKSEDGLSIENKKIIRRGTAWDVKLKISDTISIDSDQEPKIVRRGTKWSPPLNKQAEENESEKVALIFRPRSNSADSSYFDFKSELRATRRGTPWTPSTQ